MLKKLCKFLKYLEQWERYEPSNFWLCSIGLYIFFQPILIIYFLNLTGNLTYSYNKFAVVKKKAQVHRGHLLIFRLVEQPRVKQICEHKIKQFNRRQKSMSLNQLFD